MPRVYRTATRCFVPSLFPTYSTTLVDADAILIASRERCAFEHRLPPGGGLSDLRYRTFCGSSSSMQRRRRCLAVGRFSLPRVAPSHLRVCRSSPVNARTFSRLPPYYKHRSPARTAPLFHFCLFGLGCAFSPTIPPYYLHYTCTRLFTALLTRYLATSSTCFFRCHSMRHTHHLTFLLRAALPYLSIQFATIWLLLTRYTPTSPSTF